MSQSTYDLLMQDPKRRQKFEKKYRSFVQVEILIPLLQKSKMSAKILAKKANVSPTLIEAIKSGKKEEISFSLFSSILKALHSAIAK